MSENCKLYLNRRIFEKLMALCIEMTISNSFFSDFLVESIKFNKKKLFYLEKVSIKKSSDSRNNDIIEMVF